LNVSAKNAARSWGFTLVELLTVIAIIGVLATLISATLVSAQRKGRKAVSTSNLRQIALAFNIYNDDQQKRPTSYQDMVEARYLSERVLLCPEDRIVKNWAGVLEQFDSGREPGTGVSRPGPSTPDIDEPTAGGSESVADVPHSYFKSFNYVQPIWQDIERDALGGVAACQLHGIGRQSKDKMPALDDYQGLVLRALKDGSVISRQVFWGGGDFETSINPGYADTNVVQSPQLPLFLDPSK